MMGNRRMISGDLFEDDFISSLSFFDRLLWIGIITAVADDQGRMMDNPALIRSRVFLFDDVLDSQVETTLKAINAEGKITRYTAGGKKLIQIVNWWKYQTPSWASASRFLPPPNWVDRVKCHTVGNKIVTSNWDKEGGYVVGYVAMQGRAINEIKGDGDIKGEYEGEGEEPPAFPGADGGEWSPEDTRFVEVRKIIEQSTGVSGDGAAAVKAIDEIIEMGASDGDIEAGIAWRVDNGGVKYYSQIVGPTRTAMQKRVQGNGNGNGQKRAYKDANGETVYL